MTIINRTPWEIGVEDFTIPKGEKVEVTAIMGSPVGVFTEVGAVRISALGRTIKAKCFGAIDATVISDCVVVIDACDQTSKILFELSEKYSANQNNNTN